MKTEYKYSVYNDQIRRISISILKNVDDYIIAAHIYEVQHGISTHVYHML